MNIRERLNLSMPVMLLTIVPALLLKKWIVQNSGLAFGAVEQHEMARFLGKLSVTFTSYVFIYLVLHYLYAKFETFRNDDGNSSGQ